MGFSNKDRILIESECGDWTHSDCSGTYSSRLFSHRKLVFLWHKNMLVCIVQVDKMQRKAMADWAHQIMSQMLRCSWSCQQTPEDESTAHVHVDARHSTDTVQYQYLSAVLCFLSLQHQLLQATNGHLRQSVHHMSQLALH